MPNASSRPGRSPSRLARVTVAGLAPLLVLVPLASSDAQVTTKDRAARGMDLFVHVPETAAPGSMLPVQVETFGFPTAASLAPLADAVVEVGWDPQHLGPGIVSAPPSVRATSDAEGRARLLVPVPAGAPRDLHLLLVARSGEHERSREVTVKRSATHEVSVYVADDAVVPGGAVSAWVAARDASTGRPAAHARVELALVEGGMPRLTIPLTTDGAGTAMARVPIPYVEEPGWTWTLRARTLAADPDAVLGEADVTLRPREETPAVPSMRASFDEPHVHAGDHAAFTVGLRDAADRPVAGVPVRYWVGPKGTEPPATDEAWEQLAKRATTDAQGAIHASFDAPTLVARGVGTTLSLVATATVEGHALKQNATVGVELATADASLAVEGRALVPGVPQRLLLSVWDDRYAPVVGSFAVTGDGLDARVTTDADGQAEITWSPPLDVGALRNLGPCAGGVAAAVMVRPVGVIPQLASRREPFALCVLIDRETREIVSLDRSMARMGETIHVRVLDAKSAAAPAREPARSVSVVLLSPDRTRSASVWIDDAEKGADIKLPDGAPGVWTVTAASPSASRAARVAVAGVTVLPPVLPRLLAKVAGGRAAPGGTVDVDVDLTDGKGGGLPGTVAALVTDLNGGGSVAGLSRIDARREICEAAGVDALRCDRFLDGDPALDALRRAVAGTRSGRPVDPDHDPGGTARDELRQTFADVMRSLEGAVFEASSAPDRIADVRRATGRGSTWNPELMTLVTAAMPKPPLTPGGAPLSLADLIAVDPQVTFDNVARRIARLKLFYVLQAVRSWKRDHQVEPDEPMLKDPNALLRRLVRDGAVDPGMLVDPWGGTLQFVPAQGAPVPFLAVAHGFELHAPGPDGRAGTGDDVRDPFERVLRAGTPYASAMSEDRIVDARLEMEVSEGTVSSWQSVFEEFTGRSLGGAVSARGSGQGFGSGHGRLGGSHRARAPSVRYGAGFATGVAWWSAPERTDARGHLRLHVPLGDAETTWRVAFIGVPDAAPRATGWVDVPVALPLSARVESGVTWIEGDRAAVPVALRNRTASAIRATVSATASGAARLDGPSEKVVDVPAGGAVETTVSVATAQPGDAELLVTVKAKDLPDDVVRHSWKVLPAGEPTDLTRAQWVEGKATIEAALGDRSLADTDKGPLPVRLTGAPRLVLERGVDGPLVAALEAVDPDKLAGHAALLDAIEIGTRVARWAVAKEGDGSAVAARANQVVARARGRLAALEPGATPWAVASRLRVIAPDKKPGEDPPASCPPKELPAAALVPALDAEPPVEDGVALACWDALVASAIEGATSSGSALALARAYLAVADRPHRAALAATLVERLRQKVTLRPTGAITLSDVEAKDRATRAIVYAALLRGARSGTVGAAPAERLAAWIGVQRDADGGYGSALATREVVRALIGASLEEQGVSRVTVKIGKEEREVEVGPSARVVVPLPADAVDATLEVKGPGLVARLERPVIRLWSGPPPSVESPLHLAVTWPTNARAGVKGVVSIALRHSRGRRTVGDVRVPLPPGATLAAQVEGVRQIQGALAVRIKMDESDLDTQLDIPIRFGFAGRVTVPEARATVAFEEVPRALAPARPLVVQ